MLRAAVRSALVLAVALGCLAATASARAADRLFSGQTLGSGQVLTSADGHYTLTMQTDGNLVLAMANPHGSPRVLFSTGTGSSPGAIAQLQSDGDLAVLDPSGATVWSDNATASGCANLIVQDDGNLVAYTQSSPYWSSRTVQLGMRPGDELLAGQTLIAPGGLYELQMGTDGALHLVDSQGTVWSSSPDGPAGSYGVLYSNGDFEVRTATGARVWYSQTYHAEDAGATVALTATGDVEVVETDGTVAWQSDTGATRTGLASLIEPSPYTSCPAAAAPAPAPAPGPTPITPHRPVSGVTSGPIRVPLPRIRVSIEIRWHYAGATTRVRSAEIRRFPLRGRLTVTCLGRHGCPTHTITVHHHRVRRRTVFRAGAHHLSALAHRLSEVQFHVGDRVVFTITQPGHRRSRSEAIVRRGRPPRSRTLALRPGPGD